MGGRFTNCDLICEHHNGLCGQWADDPLCEQFAFAVHALEVLKGDGSRGTTLPAVAQDGTRFDILPDFRFRMRPVVERPDGGFRITATDAGAFRKIEKQISAVANFASSQFEIRGYNFVSPVSTHGPGLRGILKAALHFVVTLTAERDRVRDVCRQMVYKLFADAVPENVSVVPYEIADGHTGLIYTS